MARTLRLQFEGAIYHITARGNGRRKIFLDDRDHERFLLRLSESVDTYEVRLYLFCLMDNHIHLLLETPRGNLSRFMQSLLTGYTVYFNLRHNNTGHLMQGRYHARVVEGDEYLLKLSRYIHLNPVFTSATKCLPLEQRIQYLRSYRWSSYCSYIGRSKPMEMVDYRPILSQLHVAKCKRLKKYREFIESGLAQSNEEFLRVMKSSSRSIGSWKFQKLIDAMYSDLRDEKEKREDVSFHGDMHLVDTETVLKTVAKEFDVRQEHLTLRAYGSFVRPVAARMLCKHGGLTQRGAGKILGYGTGAAVSAQIRRVGRELQKNKEIQKQVAMIDKRLTHTGRAGRIKRGKS